MIQSLWRIIWRFLFKKLKIKLPYDPIIPLLGTYPEKTIVERDTCTLMFMTALFTIAAAAAAKSLHLCPTLYDPIDGSPPGSSVPGILQARTLEWVAISFSSA